MIWVPAKCRNFRIRAIVSIEFCISNAGGISNTAFDFMQLYNILAQPMVRKGLYCYLIILLCNCLEAQVVPASTHSLVIGFYNLENLYDTLDDPFKNDDDFTPEGQYKWTGERYRLKLEHLSKVINEMGADMDPEGPSILGFCEVENKSVLEDLVTTTKLKARNYQYILIEGPDARGVDPALIYRPDCFQLQDATSHPVILHDSTHRTRDILLVQGKLLGEPVAILVNHWPSRRGGELRSRESRNIAARKARFIADSVSRKHPGIKVLIMGDLNDDPVNECVKKFIGTYDDPAKIASGKYYNPMEKLFRRGIGTLAYQDSWNLFDQILLSEDWLRGGQGLKFRQVRINNKIYLRADYGNFKGYPFRTYSGGIYTGGYSDHFASFIVVSKD